MAHGMDLLGERWALLIVRELLLGPRRFSDLRAAMPGASADMIIRRLRELQGHDVVHQRRLPRPANAAVYELTTWGAGLESIVVGLARWSLHSPEIAGRAQDPLSVSSAVLSLRVLFDPERARERSTELVLALQVDDEPFRVAVRGGELDVARGDAPDADAALVTGPGPLAALLRGVTTLADELKAGRVDVRGEHAKVADLLAGFTPSSRSTPTAASG